MFNENYLGHNLVRLEKYNINEDYVCTKCGIEIFYELETYYLIKGYHDTEGFCVINCEEFMIKSIIE